MYAYLTFATPHQPSRGEYLREGQWEDLGTSRPKHLAWCSWAAVLFSRVWWGREWGSRRRPISPLACSSDRGLLRLTSQTPGVGCTHSVRSPGSPRRGKVEDKCQQRLLSMPCLEPATFRLYIFVSKHLPTLQKHRPSSQKCFST